MESTMNKKVWVINLNTNVKYLIEEKWFLENKNDFALTEAPVEDEPVAEPREKRVIAKKADVTKKVLK